MQCVLGVDGGNTKTVALIAALDGTILGAGRGGCGDIYNAYAGTEWPDSPAAAVGNIEYAVMSALQAAQVKASDLVTAVFNMAGADWPEDFAYLQAALEARGLGRTIIVQNDALGVLHANPSDGMGSVSVVCGTGAGTGARAPDGRTWHSSFWQEHVQGAGHLGQRTLEAVIRAELGIDPPTSLTLRVLDFFELDTVEAVLHLFTGRESMSLEQTRKVRHLTPILLDEAEAGDAAARRIVQKHGWALGEYALAAARHVGIEGTPFTLVLAGGVFRHPSSLLEDAVVTSVRTTSPDVRPTRFRFEPVIGVIFTALETAGVVIDDALIERLIPTLPLPELFTTRLDELKRELDAR